LRADIKALGGALPSAGSASAQPAGTRSVVYSPPKAAGTTNLDALLADILGGAAGGGGFRPQTAEEAAMLRAQTALYGAQAANIPQQTELDRRKMLADVAATQGELAANPRRIFEAIYHQSRVQPTALAKSLQEKITIPGFKRGTTVKGPVMAMVGKHDDEFALLPEGAVVAPMRAGDRKDMPHAIMRIAELAGSHALPAQASSTARARAFGQRGAAMQARPEHMSKGGIVSKAKARIMMREGTIRGHKMTDKQGGLFGLIAGGGKPTKLRRAQGGLSVFALPESVRRENELYRQQSTEAILGATKIAAGGTSLYDPLGGSTLTPEQSRLLGGMNIRNYGKLSPTQQGALQAALSANRVAPEDYEERLRRDLAGLNPVSTGTRAIFSGILGR